MLFNSIITLTEIRSNWASNDLLEAYRLFTQYNQLVLPNSNKIDYWMQWTIKSLFLKVHWTKDTALTNRYTCTIRRNKGIKNLHLNNHLECSPKSASNVNTICIFLLISYINKGWEAMKVAIIELWAMLMHGSCNIESKVTWKITNILCIVQE